MKHHVKLTAIIIYIEKETLYLSCMLNVYRELYKSIILPWCVYDLLFLFVMLTHWVTCHNVTWNTESLIVLHCVTSHSRLMTTLSHQTSILTLSSETYLWKWDSYEIKGSLLIFRKKIKLFFVTIHALEIHIYRVSQKKRNFLVFWP